MQFYLIVAVLLGAAFPLMAAPTVNRHTLLELREQLNDVSEKLHGLREKVHSIKESLDNKKDNDEDYYELDRRGVEKAKSANENPECIKKSIVQEKDPFILKIALVIMRQVKATESRTYITRLVNTTADRIVAKMNATHGIDGFHKRLLKAVLQLLKVRSILTIKTEGLFLDELDRKTRTLNTPDKDVDQSKVVQALEELLKGPLVKGFVSKGEERKMVESALNVLSIPFGLSGNTTHSLIKTMIAHVEEDVKTKGVSGSKGKGKHLTDNEKIKGLQKMVEDKVKENRLNLKEMKFLVKGLVAAIGERNKLSADKTGKIEARISKGIKHFFSNFKLPGNETKADNLHDMLEEFEGLPAGFQKAQSSKKNDGKMQLEVESKRNIRLDTSYENKRTVLDKLKELETLTAGIRHYISSSKSDAGNTPSSPGDSGDKVIIDAASNTRGATRIVEGHNRKREFSSVKENHANKTAKQQESQDIHQNLDSLVDNLQELVTMIKDEVSDFKRTPKVPSNKKAKHYESIMVDAAKGTMGHRKIVDGFKKKRGLVDIIGKAIVVIKSLRAHQESRDPKETEILPTPSTTALPTAMHVTANAASQTPVTTMTKTEAQIVKSTLEAVVQPTQTPTSEDTEQNVKKSVISGVMQAEIERAEAEIQKELEQQQRAEETKMLVAEEKKKAKEEQIKEKLEQEEERKREKAQQQKEKEQQKEEQAKEKKEQEEEMKREEEERKKEKKKEEEEKKEIRQHEADKNKDKKSDIPGISEAQIEADEKKIEKALKAQKIDENNIFHKLQSLQQKKNKEETKQGNQADSNKLMQELDELFAKN